MAEHVGLFLPLPERLARQYPPEGKAGEDTSPPHLTLVYIGDVDDGKVEELREVLSRIVQAVPPMDLRLLPPTTFQNEEGQTILHSPVAGPQLEQAHNALKGALQRRGFDVKHYDEFKPHVTIEYIDPGERSKFRYLAPQGRWRADSVGFWVGEDRQMLPLGPRRVVMAATDKELRATIVKFFKKNPNPSDDQVHALAERLGVDPHEFETIIYSLLTDCVTAATAMKMIAGGLVIGDRIVKDANGVKAGAIVADVRIKGSGKRSSIIVEFEDGSTVTVGRWTAFDIERGSYGMKRAVIARMLQADRPELANAVAYGGQRTSDDLLRSINTLAKYSEGLWKSEKQGNFLLNWAAKDKWIQGGREAVAWAKQTGWYDPKDKTQVVLQFMLSISGYGKSDPSKIRYAGTFALLNGTGVLATASFKVKHAKKGEEGSHAPIPGTAKTRFVRDRKVVPDMNVDPAGDEAKQLAKQLKQNEPVIKAIESIPGWKDQQIFVDFRDILLAGGTLSPNMMRVVERNVPLPVHNVGDADDIMRKMQELDRWVQQVFMPEAIIFAQGIAQHWYDKELADHTRNPRQYPRTPVLEDAATKTKQQWADYLTGNADALYTDGILWTVLERFIHDELKFNWVRHLKGARGVDYQQGYLVLRPQVNKAVPLLKRGKSPSKTAMVVMRALLALYDKMAGISRDRVKRHLDKS